MAKNPYYKTPTGKGVISTAIVGIIAIVVQTYLTVQQSNRENRKDNRDSIRAARKDFSDSIRQNKVDLRDSIRYVKAFTNDSLLRIKQNTIAQRQLEVASSQFYIREKERAIDELDQLFKLDAACDQLLQLLPSRAIDVYINYGSDTKEIAWTKKAEEVLFSQVNNSALLENKELHEKWIEGLHLVRSRLFDVEMEKVNIDSVGSMQAMMSRYRKRGRIFGDIGSMVVKTQQYCKAEIQKQKESYLTNFSKSSRVHFK